jgi:uncharacterized protein YpmS
LNEKEEVKKMSLVKNHTQNPQTQRSQDENYPRTSYEEFPPFENVQPRTKFNFILFLKKNLIYIAIGAFLILVGVVSLIMVSRIGNDEDLSEDTTPNEIEITTTTTEEFSSTISSTFSESTSDDFDIGPSTTISNEVRTTESPSTTSSDATSTVSLTSTTTEGK